MEESILNSIKKLLTGAGVEDDSFDTDLIIGINTAFSILTQMGIGPEEGFSISDDTTLWQDYIQDNKKIEMVKTYVQLKVKLIFDPPTSSAVIECIKETITELEQRLYYEFELGKQG